MSGDCEVTHGRVHLYARVADTPWEWWRLDDCVRAHPPVGLFGVAGYTFAVLLEQPSCYVICGLAVFQDIVEVDPDNGIAVSVALAVEDEPYSCDRQRLPLSVDFNVDTPAHYRSFIRGFDVGERAPRIRVGRAGQVTAGLYG